MEAFTNSLLFHGFDAYSHAFPPSIFCNSVPSPSPITLPKRNLFHPAARRNILSRKAGGHSNLQSSPDMSLNKLEEDNYRDFSMELKDKNDFLTIADNNNLISICGFGSLLSVKSARSTFPDLLNFRMGILNNFRRVFGHVAPVFLERGIANIETKEISSLSVEPCHGESIVITIFEISLSQVSAFIEREHEFRFLAVTPISLEGKPFPQQAVVCSRYNDKEYHSVRCKGSEEKYHRRYGQYNINQIWRDDIFPCRLYLRHCVLAARNLGLEAYDNFLDHTYLGDRKTTIRQYLALKPDIMEEEAPDNLKNRYGG
ncbi:hypothetical protein O6H91_20G002900 [Diphasiastrum complanatum]|uniref:Uncharacterized protein n=1 Tax=Diphasiastrum complanatum TaxID=34168 RepID=A0ACC2AM84_DIPCM|nr:hypothetical protein O6H91_20G002900 [Diphasiastrum complanatum]